MGERNSGALLADAADLYPARAKHVPLTAALHNNSRPQQLAGWARERGLGVRWRSGDRWAIIEGPAASVAGAFGVEVNDDRGSRSNSGTSAIGRPTAGSCRQKCQGRPYTANVAAHLQHSVAARRRIHRQGRHRGSLGASFRPRRICFTPTRFRREGIAVENILAR